MSVPAIPTRQRSAAASTAVEQFWSSAKQLASVASRAVSASPSALVEAGAKSRPRQIEASELAAELAELSGKLEEIRARLVEPDGPLVSRKQRDIAGEAMRKLIRSGFLVDPATFVERRKVTRQALSKALKAHRVFHVEVDAQRYLPDFFLDPRYEREQLEGVSKALGELPGASKLQFFMTRKASLDGRTPLDALAAGGYSRVLVAAQGFAER